MAIAQVCGELYPLFSSHSIKAMKDPLLKDLVEEKYYDEPTREAHTEEGDLEQPPTKRKKRKVIELSPPRVEVQPLEAFEKAFGLFKNHVFQLEVRFINLILLTYFFNSE